MPIFRILIKKGKKTPQIKNRFGGIELEVNAFPCNPDPDQFSDFCPAKGIPGVESQNCINEDSQYRFGYQDGNRWQLGYDVTSLIQNEIVWSKIQNKFNELKGLEKPSQDYEFRTVGPNDLQTLKNSIASFKTFYDPFYQHFVNEKHKMRLPVFEYDNILICMKPKDKSFQLAIKPQFTFSFPIEQLKQILSNFPGESQSNLYTNIIMQYGGEISTQFSEVQQVSQYTQLGQIFNKQLDIDLSDLINKDTTGIVGYFNLFKNLFVFTPDVTDWYNNEFQFRQELIQKSGYNNLKYFLPFLPRNSEISYFKDKNIDQEIIKYIFENYKEEGKRVIPYYIQFEDQQSKNTYQKALKKYLSTLTNKNKEQKFYRAILNKRLAFLNRSDVNRYEYSLYQYLLDFRIVLNDPALTELCSSQYLMNCLYRKYQEDEDFGYELLIPSTVVKTDASTVVLELRMMPAITDNKIEEAFQPYFDYIFNQVQYIIMSLKCNLCQSLFDESKHIPRVLGNCGHSLCQDCLQNLIQSTKEKFLNFENMFLKCPFDYTDHLIKHFYTIQNFPKNFSLLENLQVKKKQSNAKKNFFQIKPLQKIKSKSISSLLTLQTKIDKDKNFLINYAQKQFQKDLNRIYFEKKKKYQSQKSLLLLQKIKFKNQSLLQKQKNQNFEAQTFFHDQLINQCTFICFTLIFFKYDFYNYRIHHSQNISANDILNFQGRKKFRLIFISKDQQPPQTQYIISYKNVELKITQFVIVKIFFVKQYQNRQ